MYKGNHFFTNLTILCKYAIIYLISVLDIDKKGGFACGETEIRKLLLQLDLF